MTAREGSDTRDFAVDKFWGYTGPNFYLGVSALVFNLYLDPEGPPVSAYAERVLAELPRLGDGMADPASDPDSNRDSDQNSAPDSDPLPNRMADLFAEVVLEILRMDLDLWIRERAVRREGDGWVIAVEMLDRIVAEDAVYLARDWFRAMDAGDDFDFQARFDVLKEDFDRTLYGGPTIYSLVEAARKTGIPVHFLPDEDQFQWGYGRRQLRGRSTIFHTDGIKDTEFTTFKDMVKRFLGNCGFPTPAGDRVRTADGAETAAAEIGFPAVVKPVTGHKGQGVFTNLETAEAVREAFERLASAAEAADVPFDGVIVEAQVSGTDHRLLAVGGKFAAALQRAPAYVEGDGDRTIRELVDRENRRDIRRDDARSPLAQIPVDDDVISLLRRQNLTLNSVPRAGERITLGRVANVSAGGVSVNVTEQVHPRTVQMVEDIAAFFDVACLGIDVLAEDIAVSWDAAEAAGRFGIIEINAGPGVFMHLAPAEGEPVDVPGMILSHFFPTPEAARIPILVGNRLADGFCAQLAERVRAVRPEARLASVTETGLYFDGAWFCNNRDHDVNVRIALRHPQTGIAAFRHDADALLDTGILHRGADVVVLEEPDYAEEVLRDQLLPGGLLVIVGETGLTLHQGEDEIGLAPWPEGGDRDTVLADLLEPHLPALFERYD